jgi:hypothetical protein
MHHPDLRFGHVPLPEPSPGYDPAGDAAHLVKMGTPSPAREPIPGIQLLGSLGPGQRFVMRVPDQWNGDLVVCGTPATRSEFANDTIFGDYVMARGYAFASSNKGIPYNGVLEPASATPDASAAYPIPFDIDGLRQKGMVIRSGALWPNKIPVRAWHEDFAALVRAAKEHVHPKHTYVAGLSMGGGQVRWLLEREPELADGGLEWASVYWSPGENILSYLPAFIRAMPAYVRGGYRDGEARAAIVAAGFPPDRVQENVAHPSLWNDHYAGSPPFYADVTTFIFARLLDPEADSWCGDPPNVTNPISRAREAGPVNARGLALPEVRANYALSDAAKRTIAEFAHTGQIGRPLIGLAGTADVFVTSRHNFEPYLEAVRAAGRGDRYWQYLVEGGPHVDAYAALGFGLQPQLPFVWRAFDQLVRIVVDDENPPGAGSARLVRDPGEIG